MLNNEKYLSKFVMTKSGKVDIKISRTDGQKITPNEQGAICESVTNLWGKGSVEKVIPNLTDYELLELQYMKTLGYWRIRYDKRLEDWSFIESDYFYDIMAKRKYGVLDKDRDYEIEELLNAQSKRVVIVPKGVNK